MAHNTHDVAVTFLSGITRNASKSTLLSRGPHFRQVSVSFKGLLFSGGGEGVIVIFWKYWKSLSWGGGGGELFSADSMITISTSFPGPFSVPSHLSGTFIETKNVQRFNSPFSECLLVSLIQL